MKTFSEKIEKLIAEDAIAKAISFFTSRRFGGTQLLKAERYFLQMKNNYESGKIDEEEFKSVKYTFAIFLRKFASQLDEPNSKVKHTHKAHQKGRVKFKKSY